MIRACATTEKRTRFGDRSHTCERSGTSGSVGYSPPGQHGIWVWGVLPKSHSLPSCRAVRLGAGFRNCGRSNWGAGTSQSEPVVWAEVQRSIDSNPLPKIASDLSFNRSADLGTALLQPNGLSRIPRQLADELSRQHPAVSASTITAYLRRQGFELGFNRKCRMDETDVDRAAQFRFLAAQVRAIQEQGAPVLWVGLRRRPIRSQYLPFLAELNPDAKNTQVDDDLGGNRPNAEIASLLFQRIEDQGWVSLGIGQHTADIVTGATLRWWRTTGWALQAVRLLLAAEESGAIRHEVHCGDSPAGFER